MHCNFSIVQNPSELYHFAEYLCPVTVAALSPSLVILFPHTAQAIMEE